MQSSCSGNSPPRSSFFLSIDKFFTLYLSSKGLAEAASHGEWATVKKQLTYGVNPNDLEGADFSALRSASAHANYEIMVLLLEKGADPNLMPEKKRHSFHILETPLHAAIKRRAMPAVRLLLLNQANPEVNDGLGRSVTKVAGWDWQENDKKILFEEYFLISRKNCS
ncbi:MAG: ankyrin repeat domain-containing protein [Legionella sp.]